MNRSDLTPEDQAEIERNDRTEEILRWAFTVFCAIVVLVWLIWPWLT